MARNRPSVSSISAVIGRGEYGSSRSGPVPRGVGMDVHAYHWLIGRIGVGLDTRPPAPPVAIAVRADGHLPWSR